MNSEKSRQIFWILAIFGLLIACDVLFQPVRAVLNLFAGVILMILAVILGIVIFYVGFPLLLVGLAALNGKSLGPSAWQRRCDRMAEEDRALRAANRAFRRRVRDRAS